MFGRASVSALALLGGAAFAQEPAERDAPPAAASADRVRYDAAFYAAINPQNALDMVRQTPGFTLDLGDEERRGFSGAVGNVLSDGARPSAKTQSLEDILSQIPAAQVVRIELLRDAEAAGDASGASVLANVVRTPAAGSGLWNAGLGQFADAVRPFGDASYSGRRGQIEYGAGVSWYHDYREQPGRRLLYDGGGAFLGTVDTPSPRTDKEATFNVNAAAPLFGGRLSATGQASWARWHANHEFHAFDANGVNVENLTDNFTEHDPSSGFEIGLNYERELGAWSLALVGLANREDYESDEAATLTDPNGGVLSVVDIDVRQEIGESILRGSLARALGARQRLEFNLEGALNTLDAALGITEDTGAGPVPDAIPNANVTIEEERAEASLVHTWRVSESWSVESRLAWETSTLTFTGDQDQVVDLAYWKPSLQLTRTFGENNQARARLYRDVGQLDFGDFVSAAEVADNLIDGGNPDLVPETSYRAELGVDLRFAGGAALGLTYTHFWIEDVADLVNLVDTRTTADPSDDIYFDAPGNIGDASADQLDANITLPLGFVLDGLRFTASGYLWQGEVTDPVTGRTRTISERSESQLDFAIRQDLPQHKLAWSITLTKPGEFQVFRFDEIDTNEEGPWVDGYIETSALPHGLRLRFSALNVFNGDIRRNRQFFAPDRNGPRVALEERNRHFSQAPWFEVRLSGAF